MTVLYVASDAKRAGKTAFCASFAKHLSTQGKKIAVVKLLADGKAEQDADVQCYRKLLGDGVTVESAESADAGAQEASRLAKDADVVVVEGFSGLEAEALGRFAQTSDAKVIVVAGYMNDLRASGLEPAKVLFGDRLLGVVVNGTTRYAGTQVRKSLVPSLESEGLRVLGTIPESRRLLGFSVEQVRSHLQGRYFGYVDGKLQEKLVENFMIGGLVLEWGVNYFSTRSNKAVVVRGNRPDIQMAALSSPTSCLVATWGKEPLEYVVYEAEKEETPIVVVESNTLSAAEALDDLNGKHAFDHPQKLVRFMELMRSGADMVSLQARVLEKN